jgi:hypothetical protein
MTFSLDHWKLRFGFLRNALYTHTHPNPDKLKSAGPGFISVSLSAMPKIFIRKFITPNLGQDGKKPLKGLP